MQNFLKNVRYYFLAGLVLIASLVWYVVIAEERSELSVAFLDVGQGDAIFIQAPNGNQVLFDGGPNKAVLKEISQVMPFYDRSIDVLILSHPHQDHIAGLVEVMKRYEVSMVMDSGAKHSIAEFREWERLIEQKEIKYLRAHRNMRIHLDKEIYLDILSPEKDEELAGKEANEVMLVGRLVYGDTSFLLAGDMERALEYRLLADQAFLKSDVLKVGHHGSKTSSSEYFLEKVSPAYGVIQVGKNNRYKHPTQETLDNLEVADVTILRTDTDGRIVFRTNGKDLILDR